MNTSPLFYRQSNRESRQALLWSFVLHVLVVSVLAVKINWGTQDDFAIPAKVIDAVLVDSRELDKPKVKPDIRKQQKIDQQNKQRLKAEKEAIHLAKQKELAAEKAQAEQQRQQQEALLLAKQKELAAEKARAEEQNQEELRQERLEEERRLLEQEQQAELDHLQAEDDAAAKQARSNVLANQLVLYKQAIKQRVERNWIRPISAEDWYSCEVLVDQIPGGEVTNVLVERCDGDAAFQRSVKNAVYKSSPLPDPPDPALFDRKLKFTFKVPSS